jgi:hypothetical protein
MRRRIKKADGGDRGGSKRQLFGPPYASVQTGDPNSPPPPIRGAAWPGGKRPRYPALCIRVIGGAVRFA